MDDTKAALHRTLRSQREALLWKLEGLGEADARRPRTSSGTNLLGLVKHTASIESEYFGLVFGRPAPFEIPWYADGAEPDGDMFAAEDETMLDVLAFADRAWAHADATIDELPLHATGRVPWWPEERAATTLLRILVHVIADEARHAGQADVLREGIDGARGMLPDARNLPPRDGGSWAAHVARLRAIADRIDLDLGRG
ncbi:DinB family protein [Pseudoclavibacter chungangensis]|uniref:DinB family protein n=1 Tax=Pseudoclavibacter chungangensis TaxID=587635 RepID=A0A7J5BQQ4_9MICO|nr:DinB family protein [Pseudoclavibacter chungangensis]KAB1656321.1 DinB family protein [Pseudoclavibacter chungangensis]NYJ67087.1 putative damage-inducible protein DinB [Pseudoclavibacter chungangensis]